MSEKDPAMLPRRQFVKLTGASVALVPLLPLAGCGGDSGGSAADDAATAAGDVADAVEDMANDAADAAGDAIDTAGDVAGDVVDTVEEAADDAADAVNDAIDSAGDAMEDAADAVSDSVNEAAGSGLPRLTEDDALAVQLGYKHDATTVSHARYEAGQKCANCALYTGGDAPWGPCQIIPGKQVNANGWCSTYAPKAG